MSAAEPPVALLTFGLPALAWGALAAFVPVLIHLVLRQKPRRQVLPTLRFLVQAQKASTRMHRLKWFILLTCRMMALVLVAGLLMKTGCIPEDQAGASITAPLGGPVSAVIAIDDSASMQYRFQGRTRLEDATARARNLINDPERFPPGSEVSVVVGSTFGLPPVGWTKDFSAADRYLRDVPARFHDIPATNLLSHAYGLVLAAHERRREVYLFTDLTQSAWRDEGPLPPKELAGLFIMDAGRAENRNLSLSIPEVPAHLLPAERSANCHIRVRSGDTPSPGTVTLTVDGQPRDRQALTLDQPNAESTLTFALPALSAGPHAIRFDLTPDDAWGLDNARFACVAVGPVPPVLIVGDAPRESVASMTAAMIAPPALPAGEHRFLVERLNGAALATGAISKPLAIIVADPSDLAPGGWQVLHRYVISGGSAILIPGPNTAVSRWSQREDLLPAPVREVIALPAPVHVAATDLTVAYLKAFTDAGIDSINDREVYRRLELGPREADSAIIASFSDRAPAIVERRVGAGRVVLLGFSPDRTWSQFGTQAAPMIVLLHSMLESLAPKPNQIDMFLADRAAAHEWGELPASALTVQRPDGTAAPLEVLGDASVLPDQTPGLYRVIESVSPSHPVLIYGVNVAETETDAARMDDDRILARFAPGLAQVVRPSDPLPPRGRGRRGAVGWSVPLALVLVGLLWFETLFANRFYGRPRTSGATG